MNFIIYNEIDSLIKNFEKELNNFEELCFDWKSFLHEDDIPFFNNMYKRFRFFYTDLENHMKFTRYFIGHSTFDHSSESFVSFVEEITQKSEENLKNYHFLKEKTHLLDQEYQKIKDENTSNNPLENLIHLRESISVNGFIRFFFSISICYLKMEELLSIYFEKLRLSLKNKKTT